MTFSIAQTLLFAWLSAVTPQLPADPRLGSTRSELQATIDDAERAGLPSTLVANKVREGLAKRVPPERIAQVARQISAYLSETRATAARLGRKPPTEALFRAFVDARISGASAIGLATLMDTSVSEEIAVRALQSVADLAARGYDPAAAVALVRRIEDKDAGGLARVARVLEGLRRQYALSSTEALDRVELGFTIGGSLDRALDHAQSQAAAKAPGANSVGGGDRGEGNSGKGLGVGFAPGSMGKAKGRSR